VTPRLLIRPRAVIDIDEQALYLARLSQKVAKRFLKSAELSIQRLAHTPNLGFPYTTDASRLSDIRLWPIRRFPNHLIAYRQVADGIEVLRILHGARNLKDVFGA
jgi:toxin ParE1/3/4